MPKGAIGLNLGARASFKAEIASEPLLICARRVTPASWWVCHSRDTHHRQVSWLTALTRAAAFPDVSSGGAAQACRLQLRGQLWFWRYAAPHSLFPPWAMPLEPITGQALSEAISRVNQDLLNP